MSPLEVVPRMDFELEVKPMQPLSSIEAVNAIDSASSFPNRLGTYRLEKLLGRGGMGEVFLAWDERLERHVAIKRILSPQTSDERAQARFRAEARAVARLSHPSIVQIFDLLETEHGDCLVMEYVEGRELSELIARADMSLDLILRLAFEIADGLADAHSRGLIHRDLKADNVRVTSPDRPWEGRAKILDFGLARSLWDDDERESRASLTRPGILLGTIHAMSPEQASGQRVDHRSDLFALGGLLYEMLTGHPPFYGLNMLDTLRRVIGEDPVPLVERRPGLPRELVLLVNGLLEKKPNHRPQNARLVADVLARLRSESLGSAIPSSPASEQDSDAVGRDAVGRDAVGRDAVGPDAVNDSSRPEIADSNAVTGEWQVAVTQERAEIWRPAIGRSLPRRPHWILERCLSEGEADELWLAGHKSGEKRLFRLSLTAGGLPGLKREVTFFRLLKESLGRRDDIAQLVDWSFDEAPYYLEAQYSEDGDLPTWAELQGGLDHLPAATRLEIVAQICDALAAVHSMGGLHRNLRPSSVLIKLDSDSGERPRIQLSRFDVSQTTDVSRSEHSLYMAPEVLEGKSPTIQSDLYSLGVILYQMAVGDLTRVLAPGWRRDVDDQLLTEDIARIVDRSAERRPVDAREVAGWLRNLERRRAERLQRREAKRTRRALELSRRRRRQLVGVAAMLLVVVLALVFQERRTAQEAARAGREKETARQVSEFLVGLFEVADPGETPGQSLTAHDLLGRGRESLQGRLQDRPELRAVLGSALGRGYGNLGDYDAAFPLLNDAVEQLSSLPGDHRAELAAALHELAKLHFARGDNKPALELYRRALDLRRQVLGEQHPDLAVNLNDLGLALLDAGDRSAARGFLEQALDINRRHFGELHRSVAAGLHNLARVHEAEGDSETAEQLLRQALDIQRQVLGELHPDVAAGLNNLGVLLFRRGETVAAESLLRRALDQKRRIFGEVHPEVAAGLNNLAVLLQDDGIGAKSRRLYDQALSMYRELFGESHPRVAGTLFNLAVLELKYGDAAAAENRCREARRLLGGASPEMSRDVTRVEDASAGCLEAEISEIETVTRSVRQ